MPTDKNSLEIPITVDGAGKLGINIGRRNSDGAAFVAAVYESALDGCRDLRPGDLLAKPSNGRGEGPERTTEDAAPIEPCDLTLTGRPGRDESYFTSRFNPLGNTETELHEGPKQTAAELYFFYQFKENLSTGIRPLRFTAIRTVLPVQIDQPGPLGFAVEEYVPEKKNAKQKFTRVVSVDGSHAESSRQVQVGDFICYPGSRGSVNIARDLFVNTLSSCRPLYFDVVRPGFRLDAGNKTTGANTKKKNKCKANPSTTPTSAAPAPKAAEPETKFEPEPVFIGQVNHYQPEPKAEAALSAAASKAKSKRSALSAAASKAKSKRSNKPANNGVKGQQKEDTCCNICIEEVHGTTKDILLSLFQVCCVFALMGKEVDGFVGEIEDARNELQ